MAINKQGAVFVSGILLGLAALAGRGRKSRPSSAPQINEPPDEKLAARRVPENLHQRAQVQPRAENAASIAPPPPVQPYAARDPWGPDISPPPAKTPSTRHIIIFASLLVLTAVLAAGTWVFVNSDSTTGTGKAQGALTHRSMVAAVQGLNACPARPAVTAVNDKDGRFPLYPDVSGLIAADIGSFLVMGKEFAAAGFQRDAEVAYLMSCHVAEKLTGLDSPESAEAKYQLGLHYTTLAFASGGTAAANRVELLTLAEPLYADSLKVYKARYGAASEKTTSSADALAKVRNALNQAEMASPDLSIPKSAVSSNTQAQDSVQLPGNTAARRLAAASARSPLTKDNAALSPGRGAGAQRTTTRLGPSFNCNKARSRSERLICSDAELARLDRDLGRLYAKARKVTADRPAFRRQQEREWQFRETTCGDRECLFRWYSHRRDQLMDVIERRPSYPPIRYQGREPPAQTSELYRGG